MTFLLSRRTLLAVAAVLVSASAECGTEDHGCIAPNKACTGDEDSCCNGFDCFGYAFFKRCQEPPLCLREYYDCSGGIKCCGDMMCVEGTGGKKECMKEPPGTRTVELPPGQVVATPPPAPPINTSTTKTTPITFNKACLSGDPHLTTFDGLQWDCQSVGEHIIMKSTLTRRQVQGRFTRVGTRDVSVMHGIAIQDEGGAAIPLVQLTIPQVTMEGDGITTLVDAKNGCKLQLFVDGATYDLAQGFKSAQVEIKSAGSMTYSIKYTESQFTVTVRMGFWNGCLLNACVQVPKSDTVVGLLGKPDGNAQNDWMTRAGEAVPVPAAQIDRVKKVAYDYCRNNWCLKTADKGLSLFKYNQVGFDFKYFMQCDLEYGVSDVEFIDTVTKEVADFCKTDLPCLMDGVAGGIEGAKQTRFNKLELQDTQCKKEGGACDAGCCAGFTCVDTGIEKKCSATPITKLACMVRFSSCLLLCSLAKSSPVSNSWRIISTGFGEGYLQGQALL
jgi:hypothetical protein